MNTLSIVRLDITYGDICILLPIRAPTELSCKKIYIDILKEDKRTLLKIYGHEMNENFEYTYRIGEYASL
jgi:hypothetical protein